MSAAWASFSSSRMLLCALLRAVVSACARFCSSLRKRRSTKATRREYAFSLCSLLQQEAGMASRRDLSWSGMCVVLHDGRVAWVVWRGDDAVTR